MFFNRLSICQVTLLALSLVTCAADMPASIAHAMKTARLPMSSLGLIALPVDGGEPLLTYRADTAMNPASTMKLVTTFAGLELLGPAFTWRTELWTDGRIDGDTLRGNLYVKGRGDPKLTFEQYWLLLRGLKARGVRKVAGDLVLDRSYFRQSGDSEASAFDDSAERAYNVAPDSLLLNHKALRFSMESDDKSTSVRIEPPLAGVSVSQRFKLVNEPCEAWRGGWQRPEIDSQGGRTSITLQGTFPRNCRAERYLGVFDHATFADRLTRGLWGELGGEISGSTREAAVPGNATLLTDFASPALADVIRDVNKWSNNTMARAIYLTIGTEKGPANQSSAVAGEAAIRGWLGSRKLNFPELVLENGSGLSRIERISPRHLAELLVAAWKSPYAAELTSSLPIIGIDGTMKKRFANGPISGQGHIKTGTLDDVKAVAGFVRAANGRVYAIAGLINHIDAERGSGALDALIETTWRAKAMAIVDEAP